MQELNKILTTAVDNGNVPFVVAMAGDADKITFSGAAGNASENQPASEDTLFRIFSMTKAIGSVAAMQLIDRGKLDVDTPVADILPEWKNLSVLDGFDGDTPIMREPTSTATIRHLATHTSGLEYEFWNAAVARYVELTGHPSTLSGLNVSLNYPLASDPGTRWGYGPGIDWLGKIVEAVDGRRVDKYCAEEIFQPLNMNSSAFETAGMEERLSTVFLRGEDNRFAPMELAPPSHPEFYGMGHAIYSTAPDYMRFLQMILNKGQLDGEKILSENALNTMLTDHMQGLKFQTMKSASPLTADVVLPEETVHSFAFTTNQKDVPGKRSAGSQSWAGVCNTHYWVDPAKNVAAVIMTQSLPFVEAPLMATYDAYERAVYVNV